MLPNIQKVIESDQCISCGACHHICPKNNISLEFNKFRNVHEAKILNHTLCEGCPRPCDEVCPSIEVSFEKWDFDRVGPLKEVFIGGFSSFRDNGVSSSGGVVRSIISQALEEDKDVISLCKTKENFPAHYEAVLFDDITNINKLPGSIYHSVSFFEAISHIENSKKEIVLVSIPCHLEGITKYFIKKDKKLLDKIILKVGIICGWSYTNLSYKNFCASTNIDSEKVKDISYRGQNKIGYLELSCEEDTYSFDRRNFNSPHEELRYRSSFSSDMNRSRCLQCQNHLNVQSDISIGDAWLKRLGSKKESIILSRTIQGAEFLKKVVSNFSNNLESGTIKDIYESQGEDLIEGHRAEVFRSLDKLLNKNYVTYNFISSKKRPSLLSLSLHFLTYFLILFRRYFLYKRHYKTYKFFYLFTKPRMIYSYLKYFLNKLKINS